MALQKTFEDVLKNVQKPLDAPHLSPELDKVEEKDIKLFSEMEALNSGALLTATVEKGEGESSPSEGDLVFVHLVIEEEQQGELFSTCIENRQSAFAFILGKCPRMPRGLEVSVKGMRKGERRLLKVQPEFFFQHKECNFHLPSEYKEYEGHKLAVSVRLVNWIGGDDVLNVATTEHYLLKRVLREGQGWEHPRPPYEVSGSYTTRIPSSNGLLRSGDTISENISIDTVMGSDVLPKGIEAAVMSMVKQEKAVFIMPIDQYLADAGGCLPGLAERRHQVEVEIDLRRVTQVRDMYGDGKVIKRRLVEGKGDFPIDCPMEDCQVHFAYKARRALVGVKGETWAFDSCESSEVLHVDLGCGELPDGVEGCLRLMLPGETCLAHCAASMAYSDGSHPAPQGISKDEDVEFEITLVGFDRDSMWAAATDATTITTLAESSKDIANRIFHEGKYKLARAKYEKVVRGIDAFRNYDEDDDVDRIDAIKLACLGNIVLCYTKEQEYSKAVEWCDKALRMKEDNPIILVRRGKALSLNSDYEEADECFKMALQLDATLKDEIDKLIARNNQRRRISESKQQKQFSFFS